MSETIYTPDEAVARFVDETLAYACQQAGITGLVDDTDYIPDSLINTIMLEV